MSFITQFLINQGIPQETIILLLMLPIAATIIAFARQVVGIKGFGIYTPLIIAFAFTATGLKYGLIFFVTIVAIGTLARLLVKHFRLLYLPRMAIVITVVAIAILLILFGGTYLNGPQLLAAPILAVLIMIPLVEKFIAVQIERGARNAIFITAETLILSIICFSVISWNLLQELVLAYPFWFLLGSVLINIFLGKWTGLRLTEYYRFREVIKNIELPKKK
jgi:hypothetical protein